MTNYNEKLDAILDIHDNLVLLRQAAGDNGNELRDTTKQAITSLIKELVAEAKPYRDTIIDKWNKDRVDEVKATNAAMNAWADIFEQNLLKALEEV